MENNPLIQTPALIEKLPSKKSFFSQFAFYLLSFFAIYSLFTIGYLYEYYFPFSFFSLLLSNINLTISVGNDWILFVLINIIISLIILLPLVIRRLIYVQAGIILIMLLIGYFVSNAWQLQRKYQLKTLDSKELNNLFSKPISENHIFMFVCTLISLYCLVLLFYFISKYLNRNKFILLFMILLIIILCGISLLLTQRLRIISNLSLFAVEQNKSTFDKCTELKPMLKDSEKWRNFYLKTCGPVWVTTKLEIKDISNVLLYDVEFTGETGADGILTVLLDDHILEKVRESNRGRGNNRIVAYFPEIKSGTHDLLFKLEPTTFISSKMVVKDVCLGYDTTKYCLTDGCPCKK